VTLVQAKAFAFSVLSLLAAACAAQSDSQTVVDRFVRLYFTQDNLAEAVKLTGGSARAKLEEILSEMKELKVKKPSTEKPIMEVAMLEARPISQDEILYVYRIASDVEVPSMEPVTARLWLNKEGTGWKVTKFVQDE
jgi:hypothetical protein